MRRILIIGDSNSIGINCYIKHVLLGGKYSIHLTNYHDTMYFSDFYAKNNVQLINVKGIPVIKNVPKIGLLTSLLTLIAKRRKYDIIHVHYIGLWNILLLRIAASKWKKSHIVGTFWGSDLFRTSDKGLKRLNRSFKYFRYISIATDEMRSRFNDVFGGMHNEKLSTAIWGIRGFDDISAVLKTNTIEDCKTHFGINPKKTVICVGHNGNAAHQHLKVIEQISKISKAVLEKTVWIFPMTYGLQANINNVRETLNFMASHDASTISSIVLTEFMAYEDVAKLRIATDIFIHAQTTDAFSASIQECLYAGSIVINPVWIKYSELRKLNVEIVEYSEFEELPEIIENLVQNGIVRTESNRAKLENLDSWRAVKADWERLYNDEQA